MSIGEGSGVSDQDFSVRQLDEATQPSTREDRIRNMEIVLQDLENKFHQVFGHKVTSLGLVDGISVDDRREILRKCVRNFSGFDDKSGKSKPVSLPSDDPVLSQVPEREWKICERFLADLNIAYKALDNLLDEDNLG